MDRRNTKPRCRSVMPRQKPIASSASTASTAELCVFKNPSESRWYRKISPTALLVSSTSAAAPRTAAQSETRRFRVYSPRMASSREPAPPVDHFMPSPHTPHSCLLLAKAVYRQPQIRPVKCTHTVRHGRLVERAKRCSAFTLWTRGSPRRRGGFDVQAPFGRSCAGYPRRRRARA